MTDGPTRYFYIRPELDKRPLEGRTCSICRKEWHVRIPSVAQSWTHCPECEARVMLDETGEDLCANCNNPRALHSTFDICPEMYRVGESLDPGTVKTTWWKNP